MTESTTTPVASAAAAAFEEFKNQPDVVLPGSDCHAAALAFVQFCQDRGIPVEHVFVEIERGRQIAEHYMAWFPEEQVAYDLAPHNAFKEIDPRAQHFFMSQGLLPPADATHVVYKPEQFGPLRWQCGMNGSGWPGLDMSQLHRASR